MIVHDAQTLAYWERGLATTHANINANPRMSVYYRNSARRDELPRGAGWHFYGIAEIHQGDEVWQAVMARAPRLELGRDPDRKGTRSSSASNALPTPSAESSRNASLEAKRTSFSRSQFYGIYQRHIQQRKNGGSTEHDRRPRQARRIFRCAAGDQ